MVFAFQGITDQTKPTKITSRKMDSKDCKMLNCHMAQFGIALANLGDIDKDGFEGTEALSSSDSRLPSSSSSSSPPQ